eukprot:794914-Amphidinium_carterae.1
MSSSTNFTLERDSGVSANPCHEHSRLLAYLANIGGTLSYFCTTALMPDRARTEGDIPSLRASSATHPLRKSL